MGFLRKIGFFSAFIIPALTIIGFHQGNSWILASIVFVYIFIPTIDYFIGKDKRNINKEAVSKVANQYYYRFVTYCWAFFQIGFILWGAWFSATHSMSGIQWFVFLISVALSTGGIGITVAHELGHKKSKWERFLSKLLLMSVSYMHFYIEHNKGHHLRVSTPEDPATARYNENLYAFWWRSVTKGYLSAWEIENKRLERKGISKFSVHNTMIWFTALPLLFGITLFGGISAIVGYLAWPVLLFFFGQSFFAFSLLEAVNYVEHYGLLRKKIDANRYERVQPHHSWNASQMISNFFLFQLQRHSDHHFNAIKRYQVLDHYEHAPQLPAGYPSMILLAHVPPLWFAIMNKKLKKWNSTSGLEAAA